MVATTGFTDQRTYQVIKIRMACKARRKSSLRVVYSYFEQEQQIEFIELYFKGDKENGDHERIKEYLKNHLERQIKL